MPRLGLRLTPHGQLSIDEEADAPELDPALAASLAEAFAADGSAGLLRLGAGVFGSALPPVFIWWRDFAARYLSDLCLLAPAALEDGAGAPSLLPEVAPPTDAELATLVLAAPMMPGAEYLTPDVLLALWQALGEAMARALAATGADLQSLLRQWNPAWNLVGRVHFNLAENRRDPDYPFAFMATYATQLGASGKARHLPLGQALRDYAGTARRATLLSLLMPVQRAVEHVAWLRAMVEGGDIYHPLRWTPSDAANLLASVPDLEQAGIVVRMPPSWHAKHPPRPQVTASIGARKPSALGLEGLLDFKMALTLEGQALTKKEINALLAGTEALVLLRGEWVEVDRQRLQRTMARFQEIEALAARTGLSFAEAMRMLAGATEIGADKSHADADWSRVTAGPWLAETLATLRAADGEGVDAGPRLNATLRPYQRAGVQWLHLLTGLGLGACLADDMGLGKTIQVLSLLLARRRGRQMSGPSLLIAPASLLGNWQAEIEKFAPELQMRILHPSAMPAEAVRRFRPADEPALDLVIASYGALLRLPALGQSDWDFVILDEAQAIKNANAKQTKAAKALRARARIALTGTPVENHLGDLWSIFDFINPGLLGTAKSFTQYAKSLAEREHNPYGPLRELVRPYILRRMKTDKTIIADLPDKTEMAAHCHLSRKQAALYEQAVAELDQALRDSEGIQRKGIVLAMMMRLKQICNHPSQWLRDEAWAEAESGKFARLREIAEVVAARQEKMLVFTQFREMIPPLSAFLAGIFGRPGLALHGQTAVGKRRQLVDAFQATDQHPFFLLSLKAGGSGLTLTAASHVVHFDRWWNPAVENQATDRAFRIGQKRNVLVHKFVCRGTIEQKIDGLIESKRALSAELLAGGGEITLTEMNNDEILRLVALDLNAAMQE